MTKNIIVFASLLMLTLSTVAQSGKVAGAVYDGAYNDVLPFANVFIKDTEKGTTTDFEGDYSIALDEGTYTVVFSFVGYETKEIEDVKITKGEVVEINVTLNPSAGQLDEVVVTTTTRKNTEASVLNMQKNSANLLDGLSIQSINKSGSGDIAAAVKAIPGISVQEGRFVYVRGLGDRYTKTILNGLDIPGLDPDKNTIPMDIFPTNILENIIVYKSATADLPADFTGGVIDIVTKDFPTSKQMNFSFSTSYNPDMHFNENYLSYQGGKTDFLGFDDGTRALPISPQTNIPNPASANNAALEDITRSFNPILAAQRQNSFMDFGMGFNYGNQFHIKDNKLGFIASIDYKNTSTFYEGFENGIYQKPEERDEFELRSDRTQIGDIGINNVLISALSGLSYKTEKSKYSFNILHVQNGESRAALFDQRTEISNTIDVVKDNLEYTQSSITNLVLAGKHTNKDGNFLTEWKLAPTLSSVQDKDVRLTTFIEQNDGTYTISSDAGFPARIWRDLKEVNLVGKIDLTKKYTLFNEAASLKFGALQSIKKRDYSIYNYEIAFRAVNPTDLNGNPDAILSEENIWTPQTNSGYYVRGNFEPANTFESMQNTSALYISNEFKFAKNIRANLGIRMEYFTTLFTGQNNTGTEVYDNEKTIEEIDIFPSANFIYSIKDNSNIRLSYSKTTARPTFKELSVVQIVDLLTGIVFLGNLDLKPSYIDNLDIRYELFGEEAQMFAVSGFYKKFDNPIEIVAYSNIAPNNFTPRNAPSADVIGVEFEARKNFGFIFESLRNLSLNINFSLIKSTIEMNKEEGQEYDSRLTFAREGETINDYRELQGQSPYLINAGFMYSNDEIGIETGIFYNVQGKTLEVVGFGKNPDVYTQPFHSLNINFSKKFGAEQNSSISLKVNNLLNETRESLYDSFGASSRAFSLREPGRNISLGYSLSF